MLLLIKYTLLYGIVLMLVALGGMFSEHSGIIRMRKVPFIDSTGIHNLESLCKMSQKEKITVVLSGDTIFKCSSFMIPYFIYWLAQATSYPFQ